MPADRSEPSAGPLTAREREVAVLVAQDLTNREIGARLVVTGRTVATHVEHILGKLGLRSRAQIADWAAEQGLDRLLEGLAHGDGGIRFHQVPDALALLGDAGLCPRERTSGTSVR